MKKMKHILASTVVLGTLVATAAPTLAQSTATTQADWSKPIVVFGNANTDEHKTALRHDFDLINVVDVIEATVGPEDMAKYINAQDGLPMHSSVKVEKTEKGSGVRVKIADTSKITKVTSEQYSNAAITAGATDVQVTVSSPVEATGESALTGLYKAFELTGKELETDRTQVAQEELTVATAIAEEQEGNAKFEVGNLDKAIADIKINLAEHKEKNDGIATDETVRDIVSAALKAHGLDGIVSDDKIDQLVNFAKNYQETSAVDSQEVLNQLGDLKDEVTDKVGDLLKSADEHGVKEKAGNFFNSLFDAVKSIFKK